MPDRNLGLLWGRDVWSQRSNAKTHACATAKVFTLAHRSNIGQQDTRGTGTQFLCEDCIEIARYSCTSFRGIRKVAGSPDHLVRLEEDRWGDGKAQGVGGLEVDDQLACSGLLSRHVIRLRAPQDFVHLGGDMLIRPPHGEGGPGRGPNAPDARLCRNHVTPPLRGDRCRGAPSAAPAWRAGPGRP